MSTAITPEVELRETDAPVFDADAESENAKNRRIAHELFADDTDEEVAPVVPAPPVTRAPEAPPAQRRREQAAIEPRAPVEDSRGRLHRPNGTVMSNEEAAAYRASQVPTGATASPSEPVADVAPVVPNEPLEFMAYGEPISMEGSLHKPGFGCFFPEATMPQLRQYIARGHRYEKVVAENERLRTTAQGLYTQREAQADAVLDIVGKTFKDPAKLQEFMAGFQSNPQMAFRELQIAIREKELELAGNIQQPETPSDDADPAEIAEAFTDELQDFFTNPQYGLVGKFSVARQKEIRAITFQKADQFIVRVDRDLDAQGNPIVNSNQKVAIRKGETLVNRGKLLSELQLAAQQTAPGASPAGVPPVVATDRGQSPPPVARQAPPSAVGRPRAQVPAASQPGTGSRTKDTIPMHSITAAAKYLFDD